MTEFSIGSLASDAGVSVQTLRHYDRIGVLRPTARSRAGYRLYSANDRAKLDVIRTLRQLDFDLPTIGRLLAGKAALSESAALQLRALEHQSRLVRRRMSVLRVFLQAKGELDARRLKQLETLARLGREDQKRFVSDELRRRMGHNTPPAMRDTLTRLAMIELPESPTEGQLDAWLELADLAADPSFLAHYARRAPRSVSPDTLATESATRGCCSQPLLRRRYGWTRAPRPQKRLPGVGSAPSPRNPVARTSSSSLARCSPRSTLAGMLRSSDSGSCSRCCVRR